MGVLDSNITGDPFVAYRPIAILVLTTGSPERVITDVKKNGTSVAVLDNTIYTNWLLEISSVCQQNLSFEHKTLDSSGWIADTNGKADFSLDYYEVTIDSSGLPVTAYDPDATSLTPDATSNPFTVVNWSLPVDEYPSGVLSSTAGNYNLSDWQMTTGAERYLTNAPLIKDIELGQNEFLGVLSNTSPAFYRVIVYDANGVALSDNQFNFGAGTVDYHDIAIGTANLVAAGVSLTGASYYTVRNYHTNTFNATSEERRYNIVPSCSSDVRVHWCNEYGKQDSYTFKGNKTKSVTTDQRIYKRASYNLDEIGNQVYGNNKQEVLTTYTKTENPDTIEWLSEMLLNKKVCIEQNGIYLPIIITGSDFSVTNDDSPIVQFSIEYIVSSQQPSFLF
jgi:hypothetical protein